MQVDSVSKKATLAGLRLLRKGQLSWCAWATAGVAYKGNAFGPNEAEFTLGTNFWGTKALCEALNGQLKV